MNVKNTLVLELGVSEFIRLNDVEVDPAGVRGVMINEVVPADPSQDFYGGDGAGYISTTVPAVSTYKLRESEIYYNGIRIMPSYIMTGGNILIEKSKVEMASADIAVMADIIAR